LSSRINWKAEIDTLKELGLLGMRMPEIASKYGVSRQRIKQILSQYIPEWKDNYGAKIVRDNKRVWYDKKHPIRDDPELYRVQRHKFARKKANAIKVGFSWTVSFDELQWPTHCPILGIELNYYAENREEGSPSFDRINSSLGYDSGNVMIVSWRANRIKNDGTIEEHEKIASFLKSLQP
jgi:hypothetical protein